MEFSAYAYLVWGLVASLFMLVFRGVRMAIAKREDRCRRGREIIGLAQLMRERHRDVCRGIITRPQAVPARSFLKNSEANAAISRSADAAAGAFASIAGVAEANPPRAERLLGLARRYIEDAERTLKTRNVHLREQAIEQRCMAKLDLHRAQAAQEYGIRCIDQSMAAGYRLAVQAARLHMLGNALSSVRALVGEDPEQALVAIEELMRRMSKIAADAARKIAFTRRIRDLSAAFPVVAARARAAGFSVIRLRFDLDPRVNAETGRVVRDISSLLQKAEEKMRHAEARLASGNDDLQQAAADAQQAVMIASIIEQRIFAAAEEASTRGAEGQPPRKRTILH